MSLLEKLTNALPASLQPYAKAVTPAVLTLVAVGVQWVNSGVFDQDEVKTAVIGAVTAVLTYAIPNKG